MTALAFSISMYVRKPVFSGDYRMASILVTGSAGFIGSNLCRTLLNEGHVVMGVDNYITGSRSNTDSLLTNERFLFHEHDITAPDFGSLFAHEHIEYVYHLACPTGVPNLKILAAEMLATCSIGMYNVLEVARTHQARTLFTSTAEVYGQPEKFPQDESYNGNVSTMGERSPYEEGKRFSEAVLAMYVRKHGLNARVVRVFNTYGPGMSLEDRRVIPQFLRSIMREEPLRIFGDGSQTRCHIYVDDLIAGLRTVMEEGNQGEAYNVGSERPMTVRELAELATSLTGHNAGISYEPHFIEDHRHRLPSVEKAKSLGWKRKVEIEEGLQRMVAHYFTNASVQLPETARVPTNAPSPREEITEGLVQDSVLVPASL